MTWEVTAGDPDPSLAALALIVSDKPEAILALALADVRVAFRNATRLSAVPDEAEPLIRKLAIIALNSEGTEGLASESYAGVSQSFLEDLPAAVRRELNGFRRVGW